MMPSTRVCLIASQPPCICRCAGAPSWPLGELVPVRELLALSTLFYFQMAPKDAHAAAYLAMWDQVGAALSS